MSRQQRINLVQEVLWEKPDGVRPEVKIVEALEEQEQYECKIKRLYTILGIMVFLMVLITLILIKLPRAPWPV